MMFASTLLRSVAVAACIAMSAVAADAAEEFPFGLQMSLDAAAQPGSKRVPNLDIGEAGQTLVELWCGGGKGQFSVAGDTIVFVAGAMENRNCSPARAQADADILAALGAATNWRRQGDAITFVGAKSLRFRLNTN
jgi:heat shock protein HslJ